MPQAAPLLSFSYQFFLFSSGSSNTSFPSSACFRQLHLLRFHSPLFPASGSSTTFLSFLFFFCYGELFSSSFSRARKARLPSFSLSPLFFSIMQLRCFHFPTSHYFLASGSFFLFSLPQKTPLPSFFSLPFFLTQAGSLSSFSYFSYFP